MVLGGAGGASCWHHSLSYSTPVCQYSTCSAQAVTAEPWSFGELRQGEWAVAGCCFCRSAGLPAGSGEGPLWWLPGPCSLALAFACKAFPAVNKAA